MLVPRYWSKAESVSTSADGKEIRLRSWGCSPDSEADAALDARRRLEQWSSRWESGETFDGCYPYRCSLIREPLIEEIHGTGFEPLAFVTRNHYGSLVLNAAKTLFLDIDMPRDSLFRRLAAWLSGSFAPQEERVLDQLRRTLETESAEGFRIYRTAAGFRVIGTSREWEPDSEETRALMQATKTDRAFMALCRTQKSFRARLTPKSWRLKLEKISFHYPFDDAAEEARLNAWLRTYEVACHDWATCHFLDELGSPRVHESVRPVLAYHDVLTRAAGSQPLA